MSEGLYFALGGFINCTLDNRSKPRDPKEITVTGVDSNGILHAYITDDISKANSKYKELKNAGYTEIKEYRKY